MSTHIKEPPATHWLDRVLVTDQLFDSRYQVDEALSPLAKKGVRSYRAVDLKRSERKVVLKVALSDDPLAVSQLEEQHAVYGRIQSFERILRPLNEDSVRHLALSFHYVVLPFLEGGSLRDFRNALSDCPEELSRIVQDLCAGLSALHRQGLAHLNIKPSNLLRDAQGDASTYFLTDPRSSGLLASKRCRENEWMDADAATYAAPEFLNSPRPRDIGAAADIYQLGLLIFELIDGVPPFEDEDPHKLLEKHRRTPPPALKGDAARLNDFIQRCLAKVPEERFENVDALLEAFEGAISASAPLEPSACAHESLVQAFRELLDLKLRCNWIPQLEKTSDGKSILVTIRRGGGITSSLIICATQRGLSAKWVDSSEAPFALDHEEFDSIAQWLERQHQTIEISAEEPADKVTQRDREILFEELDLEMIRIDPMQFWSGYHEPTLSSIGKAYWLGKFPVTQGQFELVTRKNPSLSVESKQLPVENVSWSGANDFCRELTLRYAGLLPQGYEFRLPTQAEWECACRAGTKTLFFFGDNENEVGLHAWTYENSPNLVREVGSESLANPWGFYGMHGNIGEWCHDAEIDDGERKRVYRGGSVQVPAIMAGSGVRGLVEENFCSAFVGFRVALAEKRNYGS